MNKQRDDINVDFKIKAQESTNEQIVDVLKKRNYYQPEAVEEFIKEAIKREIIFSEQDLFDDKYKAEELKFSWIPVLNATKSKDKLRKSISRSFVICGIIPLVLGIVKVNQGNSVEGGLVTVFSLIWIFLSSQLVRMYTYVNFVSLIIFNFIGGCYGFYKILQSNNAAFMDTFILVIVLVLINYGLAFIHKNFR